MQPNTQQNNFAHSNYNSQPPPQQGTADLKPRSRGRVKITTVEGEEVLFKKEEKTESSTPSQAPEPVPDPTPEPIPEPEKTTPPTPQNTNSLNVPETNEDNTTLSPSRKKVKISEASVQNENTTTENKITPQSEKDVNIASNEESKVSSNSEEVNIDKSQNLSQESNTNIDQTKNQTQTLDQTQNQIEQPNKDKISSEEENIKENSNSLEENTKTEETTVLPEQQEDLVVGENKVESTDADDDSTKENKDVEEDEWEQIEQRPDSELIQLKDESDNNKKVYATEYLQQFRDQFTELDIPELKILKEIFKSPENPNSPHQSSRKSSLSHSSSNNKKRNNYGKKDKPPRKRNPPQQRKVQIVSKEDPAVKKATSILNKIAPENSAKLTKQLQELHLNIEQLKTVTKKIFDKALTERKYCNMYASLCSDLYKGNPSSEKDREQSESHKKEFRTILITNCQNEFDARKSHTFSEDPAIRMQEDSAFRARMRGNMEFVGQLSLRSLLSPKVIEFCFSSLLAEPDSINIEAFCKLMSTVGRQYESRNRQKIDGFFDKLKEIKDDETSDLDNRIRFMILDIIELRENNWIERRKQNVATTIDKVHETYEKEKSQVTLNGPSRVPKTSSSSSNFRNQSKTQIQKPSSNINKSDDGWQTVSGQSSTTKGGKNPNPKQKPSTTGSSSSQNKSQSSTQQSSSDASSKNKFSGLSQDSFSSPKQQSNADVDFSKVVSDSEKRKNLTYTTLEEFYNSKDIDDAFVCIKEDVLGIAPGESSDVEAKVSSKVITFILQYLFDHIRSPPGDVVPILEKLFNENIIPEYSFKTGIRDAFNILDDITELIPNAPARVGFIIGKLYSTVFKQNISFIKAPLKSMDEMNRSKLVYDLFSVLQEDIVSDYFFILHFQKISQKYLF